MVKPLLEVNNLQKIYTVGPIFNRKRIQAVRNVSFMINEGETFGLVGESGCGKSTTGRAVIRLTEPTSGSIVFDGVELLKLSNEELRKKRSDVQIIFQDPYSSFNPRMTVENILEEPFKIQKRSSNRERHELVSELMEEVSLPLAYKKRYPHQFSGGQRQRIGIARALALNPKLIVADEPVSALDVSVQAQVLNLMLDLQEKHKLTYLFISHDLNVVKYVSHRIGVMYLGEIVEMGTKEELYKNPLHPYTRALLSSVPSVNRTERKMRISLTGDVPNPANPPTGCSFHTRCPECMDSCKVTKPEVKIFNEQTVSCHLYN